MADCDLCGGGFGRAGRVSGGGSGGEMDPRGDQRRQSDYSLPASFIFIFNTRGLHLCFFFFFFLLMPWRPTCCLAVSSRSPRFNCHDNKSVNWLHSLPTSAVIEPWQGVMAGGPWQVGVASGRGVRGVAGGCGGVSLNVSQILKISH